MCLKNMFLRHSVYMLSTTNRHEAVNSEKQSFFRPILYIVQ